jgi:hypothetical protein
MIDVLYLTVQIKKSVCFKLIIRWLICVILWLNKLYSNFTSITLIYCLFYCCTWN